MSKVMQVKQFNQLIASKSLPILEGWHYLFIIPGTDKLRQKGWVAYTEEKSIIEYARWYPNRKQAQEDKV